MIEKFKRHMKERYDYDVTELGVYKTPYTVNKIVLACLVIFTILFFVFIFDAAGVFNSFMNVPILIFALFAFVLVPLALKKRNRYQAIYVTPKYIVKQDNKTEYSVIDFNEITGFKVLDDGILIKAGNIKIIITFDLFREDVEPIINILEAKGKTFDESRDYMIRDIEIHIVENKIEVVDVVVKTKSEKLYAKFTKDFDALTPNFSNEVIYQGSVITEPKLEDGHLSFKVNKLIIKEGHPENTTFDKLYATDCGMIYEDFKFLSSSLDNNLSLEEQQKEVLKLLGTATISDLQFVGKNHKLIFTAGIQHYECVYTFDKVYIGWNQIEPLD